MCKAMKRWWRDKHIYRAKTVHMKDKCKRVHNHVYSTVLRGVCELVQLATLKVAGEW